MVDRAIRGTTGRCSNARSGLSNHTDTAGKGSVYVPRRLPDTVGKNSDPGDGEDVAESVRAPWFGRTRSSASRSLWRTCDGALRTGRSTDGGFAKQAGC